MSTSPFSSFKEYVEAKGAIYTFANNSTAITILLILSLLVFLGLLVFSCLMKSRLSEQQTPSPNLVAMSVALLTGFLPGLGDWQPPRRQEGLAQGAIATVLASIGLGSALKKRRRWRKYSRYL
jgi:hypothetical protein